MDTKYDLDRKADDLHLEDVDDFSKTPHPSTEERLVVTEEQSNAVRRKIDRVILPLLCWVYFLQILDKLVIGYGSVLTMQHDTHLSGNQYSLVGSAGYWAQLGYQPISALVIVRVPTRILMPTIVLAWGVSLCGMAATSSFQGLIATRFLLGLFEASCLPLFAVITTTWYRRREQPLRIALWYGGNGTASILGSFLAWALSHLDGHGGKIPAWRVLFIITGVVTVLTGPILYWRLDNSPAEARFLTPEERLIAVERLRDNKTGPPTTKIDWAQIWEATWSPITWLFCALAFAVNAGASVTSVFGPLIIKGFGFTSQETILLNIPFGALQLIFILSAAWGATKFSKKGPVLGLLLIPVIAGTVVLYSLGRAKKDTAPLLVAYYILSPLYACNPLIVAWIGANIAGQSKKSAMLAFYQAASSSANLVAPLLFSVDQKPYYHKGLKSVLGMFVAGIASVGFLMAAFIWLNRRNERRRVANGKPAKIHDRSMDKSYNNAATSTEEEAGASHVVLSSNADLGLTDLKNDEFVYAL